MEQGNSFQTGSGALLPRPPASLGQQHPWTCSIPGSAWGRLADRGSARLCAPPGTALKQILHRGSFISPSWGVPGVENLLPGCEEESGQGIGEGLAGPVGIW